MVTEPKFSAYEQMQLRMSIQNPKWMFSMHRFFYRLTGGVIGASMRGISVMLLTTTGRKTGKQHTLPMMYLKDGDQYVICAANAGLDRPPAWLLNLLHNPQISVQVRGRHFRAVARKASEDERKVLWTKMCQMNPYYIEFQKRTQRILDLVIIREADV